MGSFRVRGKIFATVPDDTHLRVMVDEIEIRAAVAANPEAAARSSTGENGWRASSWTSTVPNAPWSGAAHRRLDPARPPRSW